MVFQSQKSGCVWKTPFRKFGHIFLHILQNLIKATGMRQKKCNMVWELLEKIVLSTAMMSEGKQDAADHFISASTNFC